MLLNHLGRNFLPHTVQNTQLLLTLPCCHRFLVDRTLESSSRLHPNTVQVQFLLVVYHQDNRCLLDKG